MRGVQELRKTIGARVKELRLAHGWTQAEVAKRARITQDFLGRAERGQREPSLYVLTKLASSFGVEPIYLLTDIETKAEPGQEPKNASISKNLATLLVLVALCVGFLLGRLL
jgi:transcriptional regulator with XRE-family HTH domain